MLNRDEIEEANKETTITVPNTSKESVNFIVTG